MLLEDKNAVIYRADGAIGGSKAFAREGARVLLTGRTREGLDEVAGEITAAGGQTKVAVVAALDEQGIPLIDVTTADSIVVANAARVPRVGRAS